MRYAGRIVAAFLCALFILMPICIFADSETDVIPIEPEMDECPTRPRPDKVFFSDQISLEMIEKSTNLYHNMIALPPEVFLWDDAGIKLSCKISSDEDLERIRTLAEEITVDCQTDEDKIREVAIYLAQNIGYDYDYYNHKAHPYPPCDPISVIDNGYTVCAGYARTYEALLQVLGIPCVYVESPNHAWNIAYSGERWIFVDTNWLSNSRYEFGQLTKSTKLSYEWYDFNFSVASTQYNHVITLLPYEARGGVLYKYPASSGLGYIVFANDISEIAEDAFRKCVNFRGDLVIPEGIKKIGKNAFNGCVGFDGKLVLPDSLTEIGIGAFRGCVGFTGDLNLPAGLDSVANYAFYGCSGFDGALTLPEGIKSIGGHAFRNCSFTGDIVIPKSVSEIGAYALRGCATKNVYFEGDAPGVYSADIATASFESDVTLFYRSESAGWTDGTWNGYKSQLWDTEPTCSISGTFSSYNPAVTAEVSLMQNGEVVYTYTVEASVGAGQIKSEYVITGVAGGVYDLVVSKDYHLSYTVKGITVEDEDITLDDEMTLSAGDVNGDGCIDLNDVIVLTSSNTYGKTVEDAATKSADVNGDGCFDLSDLVIITSAENYGKSDAVVEYK